MNPVRICWALAAVLLFAFVVFEGVKYGAVAVTVVVVSGLLPDVSLIGAFRERGLLRPERVRFYNLMHRPWIAVVLMTVGATVPLPPLGLGLRGGLEIFLAGLAWLTHIAVDRAAGFGLREPDGRIRPVGVRPAPAPPE